MSVLGELRRQYHEALANGVLGLRGQEHLPNVADTGSAVSKDIAQRMVAKLNVQLQDVPKSGQTLGKEFGDLSRDFLEKSFEHLAHVRPGAWSMTSSQIADGIAAYWQYNHLLELQEVLAKHPQLKTALGGDYLITPDIVVSREPLDDGEINANEELVGKDTAALRALLRKANYTPTRKILHASISCKWTMRSDRAQNTRTEALNLIRNRKGHAPHIVVITFEPLPSRIASIAMGTGDVDCTYHAALDELLAATHESGNETQIEVLDDLVNGKRLRDVSDLPLDLAV